MNYYKIVIIQLGLSCALVNGNSVTFGIGPSYIDKTLILLPSQNIVDSAMPLVSQSSTIIPWNYGPAVAGAISLNVSPILTFNAGLSNVWIHKGQGIVRSFSKNPLDPVSARLIPYVTSDELTEFGYELGISLKIPRIFNDTLKLEAGYSYDKEHLTVYFLQNNTIFYEQVRAKTAFIGGSMGYEWGKCSLEAGYLRLYKKLSLHETQNNAPDIVYRRARLVGNSFSVHISYAINEHWHIAQAVGYSSAYNPKVGTSITVIPNVSTTTLQNIARWQGRSISLKTAITYIF